MAKHDAPLGGMEVVSLKIKFEQKILKSSFNVGDVFPPSRQFMFEIKIFNFGIFLFLLATHELPFVDVQ